MTLALGLLPLLVPAAALALTFAVRRPGTVLGVARTCGAALWLLGLLVVLRPPADWDAFARWYCLLVLALGGLGLWVSVHYVGTEHLHGEVEATGLRRYFLLYEGFVLSLLAVGALPNYVAIWAAVEGTTLTTVLLVAFPGGQRPVEAAWKYVVVTGIGGLFGLLGTVLLVHGAALALDGWTLGATGAVPGPGGRTAIEAGLVLAVVGYGSKAGLVPFHTWLPDAHSEAPAPVSALLSAVKLVGGLYALFRLTALATRAIGPAWPHALLVIVGLLSLGLAAAAIPGQRDLKRMFAYSSIEHMGIIALGAGFGGVGLLGALLHMWTHGFGKSALFYGSGNVRLRLGATGAPAVRGVLGTMPLTGTALALGAAVIVGLPPFGLFWSEWLVLLGGVRAGEYVWVALALALLLVNLLGFGLRLPPLLLGSPPAAAAGAGREPAAGAGREPAAALWPLGIALGGALVSGLLLPAVLHGTWLSAASLIAGGAGR